MTGRLRGRVGVVTGAGRGAGRGTALALAADGMHLALLARPGSQVRAVAEQVAAEHRLPVLPFAVDVADAAAVDRVVAHVEQRLGPVDLLVDDAAAAESVSVPFREVPVEQSWARVETDLRGPFLLCRALLPAMVARGHGHVVTVGSRPRSVTATGADPARAVSERALPVFTAALAAALSGTGVVALAVPPGPTSPTGALMVEVALGLHDHRAGTVLDPGGASAR